ncbi:disease resistance protein RPM1 [Morus notabilis]|uniref:disease resistance protein RPM1 n=1 Tax=Morus notabilis TaxID=981085 RepID=UPI000CED7554|nr:disease resistance protein RPM1 [Morus notabilis]
MAEIVVEIVKDKLLSFFTKEVSLLQGVAEEVEEIARELGSILYFIKDADKRAETEGDEVRDGAKSWVQELREVSFEVEDVVTEYTHHMAQQPCRGRDQWGFVEWLREISCFLPLCCSRLKQRHDLAWQIENIKKRLIKIHDRGKAYGFVNSIPQPGSTSTDSQNVVTSYDPRRASRYLQEADLVVIESARDELVGVLLDESSQRIVIPVVGMGGLGKTTLAQQVYNHVQGGFQCHAWVQVPEPYRREEILRTLIMGLFESTKASVPTEIHSMDEGKLTNIIRVYLKDKKYLVIFDDVWKEDFWGDVEHALIDNKVSGRVMITTRKLQVAEFCGCLPYVHVHKMQHLPTEKSWELFCMRTFKPDGYCPKELEKISGEIVEKCRGLPLAIVVIAGLLSRKNKTVHEWRRIHDSLTFELEHNVHLTSILNILSLSYNELPYYLKSCFLYFGMFPRHHSIRNGRLIREWIAEGFVKAEEGKTLEDVAQEYLSELINRCLVEAPELDMTGKPKKCCVHDLLHVIILKKTKEVRFCGVFPESTESKIRGITRRLSIMINSSNDDLQEIKFPHVHSVTVFCTDETLNNRMPVFETNFKFLKVLDFEDAPCLDHLPDDIGNLFDLRYLSVRGTKVKRLPKSLKKLENLETLDLRKSLVYELPAADTMKKLCKLRNIYALNIDHENKNIFMLGRRGVKVVDGIGFLKALQKLLFIEIDREGDKDLFKELGNLTQLRTLGIFDVRSEDCRSLCSSVEKMKLLESLNVASAGENEVVDLEFMSSPRRLNKLPQWFAQLQTSLVKLRLIYSKWEDDRLLQAVENMHNLLHLEIYCVY